VNYDVICQSKQSYYDLLAEAGITWKEVLESKPQSKARSCKRKTKRNSRSYRSQSVWNRVRTLSSSIFRWVSCWGDVCGYGWRRSDMRVEISIANERSKQTYFGVLNDRTKAFIILRERCE